MYAKSASGRNEERTKRGDIDPIRLGLDGLRRLQQFRDPREPRIVEHEGEGVQSELTFPDVLVPVDAAAEELLRVVQMKRADVRDADVPIELLDRPFVSVPRPDVITRREDVASVDAHSDARAVVDAREHFSQLIERAPE